MDLDKSTKELNKIYLNANLTEENLKKCKNANEDTIIEISPEKFFSTIKND